jgi:predicted dinucleotide-binding enzyme
MRIGVLGSGPVGQAIGAKLVHLTHDVMLGSRTPEKLREWVTRVGNRARVGSFPEAAAHGELVFNCTAGAASLEVLRLVGAAHLDGKVLVDVANPLDFSQGVPPTLAVCNTDSLGERIQRAFPAARVVKALNTMNASVMTDPEALGGGDHHVFVCGNDAGAKAQVTALLRAFGWRNILDLGDITGARATEMLLPIWLRLWGVLGTPRFNLKVVQ